MENIIKYIDDVKKKGFKEATIKSKLEEAGYKAKLIEDAFKNHKKRKFNGHLIISLSLICILIWGGVIYQYYNYDNILKQNVLFNRDVDYGSDFEFDIKPNDFQHNDYFLSDNKNFYIESSTGIIRNKVALLPLNYFLQINRTNSRGEKNIIIIIIRVNKTQFVSDNKVNEENDVLDIEENESVEKNLEIIIETKLDEIEEINDNKSEIIGDNIIEYQEENIVENSSTGEITKVDNSTKENHNIDSERNDTEPKNEEVNDELLDRPDEDKNIDNYQNTYSTVSDENDVKDDNTELNDKINTNTYEEYIIDSSDKILDSGLDSGKMNSLATALSYLFLSDSAQRKSWDELNKGEQFDWSIERFHITNIHGLVNKTILNSEMKITVFDFLPLDIEPISNVHRFIKIESENIDLTNIKFQFKVHKLVVNERNFALFTYKKNWTKLPTKMIGKDFLFYRYESEIPELEQIGTFAIRATGYKSVNDIKSEIESNKINNNIHEANKVKRIYLILNILFGIIVLFLILIPYRRKIKEFEVPYTATQEYIVKIPFKEYVPYYVEVPYSYEETTEREPKLDKETTTKWADDYGKKTIVSCSIYNYEDIPIKGECTFTSYDENNIEKETSRAISIMLEPKKKTVTKQTFRTVKGGTYKCETSIEKIKHKVKKQYTKIEKKQKEVVKYRQEIKTHDITKIRNDKRIDKVNWLIGIKMPWHHAKIKKGEMNIYEPIEQNRSNNPDE